MTEPTACSAGRCSSPTVYCGNCDLLVGLEGLHVVEVVQAEEHLRVRVESPPGPMGCPACGVVALSHGRREVELIDAPCFGRPVRVLWRKRTWTCPEPACGCGSLGRRVGGAR
ncbi:transposase family protein [Humibacillus xanthopallidus]|uniref:transposase family protein n=2 Tax=Humibacillus xanthopallidus TaxID=412689 RepID=UPI0031D7128E